MSNKINDSDSRSMQYEVVSKEKLGVQRLILIPFRFSFSIYFLPSSHHTVTLVLGLVMKQLSTVYIVTVTVDPNF